MSEPASLAITRRLALRLLGAGFGAGLLAACGPASPPAAPATLAPAPPTLAPTLAPPPPTPPPLAATPTPSAAATLASQPKTGGTLRTGQVGDIANLDGHYANQLSATTVQM